MFKDEPLSFVGLDNTGFFANYTRLWSKRTDRYSERRSESTADLPKVEMSYIGG